jgi:hypothetical protein
MAEQERPLPAVPQTVSCTQRDTRGEIEKGNRETERKIEKEREKEREREGEGKRKEVKRESLCV